MVLAAVVFSTPAQASLVDITVSDGLIGKHYGSGTDPQGIGESGYVTVPAVASADWDLRASAFDGGTNQLTVVSGFNPLTKNNGFGLGDIFIDTNNAFTIPAPLSSTLNSAFGFEYAIDLINPWSPSTPNTISYQILSLAANTQFTLPAYGNTHPELAKGAPVLVSNLGSGSVLSPGVLTSTVTTMTDAQVLANLGLNIGNNGGTNYIFSFFLPDGLTDNGATFRLTQECGNDLMVGHVAAVPETSTWVMGFLAVGAVFYVARRRVIAG
jgi:hypothetical protein